MTITATYDAEATETMHAAVAEALFAAEAAHPASPELAALHTALNDLQTFLFAGVNEDSEDKPPAPRSGGDKPPGV